MDDIFKFDQFQIAVGEQVALRIPYVGDSPAHSRRKVAPRRSEHDDPTPGHVFATVIAHALNHGSGPGVADAETLRRPTAKKSFTAGSTVEDNVTHQNIFLGNKGTSRRGIDNNTAPRKTLAHIVVGISLEFESNASGKERSKTLTGRTFEMEVDGAVRKPLVTPTLGDLVAENRTDRTVGIDDL